MISRSATGSRPTFTSTCAPGTRSRMALASAERSSAMRMRIALALQCSGLRPLPGRRGTRLPPRHGRLRGREALAELDAGPEIVEAALDGPDDDEHVEIVEVAEVRYTEDLPLRFILSSDQLDPVAREEMLHELLRVDARRSNHRRHRGGRSLRVELEAERLHSRPRSLREPLVTGEAGREPFFPVHLQRLVEALDERDGGRPRGLVLALAVPLAAQVEVEARQVRRLVQLPGASVGGEE